MGEIGAWPVGAGAGLSSPLRLQFAALARLALLGASAASAAPSSRAQDHVAHASLGLAVRAPQPIRPRSSPEGRAASPGEGSATAPKSKVLLRDSVTGSATRLADATGGRKACLVFWATFCKPCLDEGPELLHLARRHPQIEFIGLAFSLFDARPQVRKAVEAAGLPGRHLLYEDLRLMTDVFGAEVAMPSFAVLDAGGEVTFTMTGTVKDEGRLRRLDEALCSLGRSPEKCREAPDERERKSP